jgi:hypothetical protein
MMTFEQLRKDPNQNPIIRGMQTYRTLLSQLIEDKIEPLMFVGGDPGIGKSYELKAACKKAGVTFAPIAPGGDLYSFVYSLWLNRDAHVILLDDHDKLLTSPKAREIVKHGWGPERLIIQDTKRARQTEEPPPYFPMRSRLVWLSNQDANQYNDADLDAIKDRGAHPLFVTGTREERLQYVIHTATCRGFFRPDDKYGIKVKEEAINWLIDNRNHLALISLRTLESTLLCIYSNGTNREAKRVALGRLLKSQTTEPAFQSFNHLKMVRPGKWQEADGGDDGAEPEPKTTQHQYASPPLDIADFKLSKQTRAILANFSKINDSIIFRPGKIVTVVSKEQDIVAYATVEDVFPDRFAIGSITKFLSILSLYDNPTLRVHNDCLAIKGDGNKQSNLALGDERTIQTTEKGLDEFVSQFGDPVANFTPDFDELRAIQKNMKIAQLSYVTFTSSDDDIVVVRVDPRNDQSDEFVMALKTTTKPDTHFDVMFTDRKIVNMLAQTYAVSIYKPMIRFAAGNIEYFTTPERPKAANGGDDDDPDPDHDPKPPRGRTTDAAERDPEPNADNDVGQATKDGKESYVGTPLEDFFKPAKHKSKTKPRYWYQYTAEEQKFWDIWYKVYLMKWSSNENEALVAATKSQVMLDEQGLTLQDVPDRLQKHFCYLHGPDWMK